MNNLLTAEATAKTVLSHTIMSNRKNDCYSAGERKWMEFGQHLRHVTLLPLLQILTKLRISADVLTGVALILGISFLPLWIYGYTTWAFLCLLAHVLIDGLDGPLARYQEADSPRGSFTDTFADQIVLSIVTLSWMITAQSASAISAGTTYIFLYAGVVALAMVRNALSIPYSWLLRPRFVVYGFIFLDVVLQTDYSVAVIWVCNAILLIKLISGFYFLRRALPGPNGGK